MFAVRIAIGARTTKLWMLSVEEFKYKSVYGKRALIYYPKVDSRK